MIKPVSEFIHSKEIDTIQKLNLLLLLYQNPETQGTIRCFAERLHLRDIPLLEKIIRELAAKKVITFSGQHYSLADDPDLKASLQHLTILYEHPLTRQSLLAQIQAGGQNGFN